MVAKTKNIEGAEENLQNLKSQIKKDEKELESVDEELMACSNIRENVLVLDNLDKESKIVEKAVQDLVRKMEESGGISDRSYEEVKKEEDLKAQDLDIERGDLEDLRSKKVDYETKLNTLTSQRNSLFNDKLQLESKQQDRTNMEEKRDQLEKQINTDDKDLAESRSKLAPI